MFDPALLITAWLGFCVSRSYGESIDSCTEQSDCLELEITKEAGDPCMFEGEERCVFKACMTLSLGDDSAGDACIKAKTDSVSHICDQSKEGDSCPNNCPDTGTCPAYSNRDYDDPTDKQPGPDGKTLCQIGKPGDVVEFVYKDGSTCADSFSGDLNGDGISETCRPKTRNDPTCSTGNGQNGKECIWAVTLPNNCNYPACIDAQVCDDPHLAGLRGQDISWWGADGAWYCLLSDSMTEQQVNIRPTAVTRDIPHRQMVTGFSVVSEGHSVVVEVDDPYTTATEGCAEGNYPCLADGAVRVLLDGEEARNLHRPVNRMDLPGGMTFSSTNLPLKCQHFNTERIWAQHTDADMVTGSRDLRSDSFEEFLLKYEETVDTDWCSKYIADYGIDNVQSSYAVFWIETPSVAVHASLGINHQYPGFVTSNGHVLKELDMWQMNVGVDGLPPNQDSLSGLLGETARPVLDKAGKMKMFGRSAMRGATEEYRVSGPEATDFPMLHKSHV